MLNGELEAALLLYKEKKLTVARHTTFSSPGKLEEFGIL